ncbi:MAG: HEPN domain-containing protein [Deltaproteobacteria bacterium]|nr:MAG: HEPN domain-containing protein [Deltaproteobacteria bacterium]
MTTQEMARSFLRRAAAILREAERLLGDEAWNLVVRRCQEAVEFALKGALREAGVEVPKVHDVSGALRRNTRRLPAHLAAEIDLLVSASRRLREERELAFYGDEETETEAEALFSREDAEDALRTARRVVEVCTAGRRGVKRPS